jgi:hypothetical protein
VNTSGFERSVPDAAAHAKLNTVATRKGANKKASAA